MDRNRVFIPASEKLQEMLSEKHPGLTATKIRSILKTAFDTAINKAIDKGALISIQYKRLSISVCRRKGYNYIPIKDRGLRAISYDDLGVEYEITFHGKPFDAGLYKIKPDNKYRKKLQEKIDDPEYVKQAL